jgi:hypothetical protein
MTTDTQNTGPMIEQPTDGHRWLERLLGEWTYEGQAGEQGNSNGRERVRTLDGLWYILEATGEPAGGGPEKSIMTLGFDPQTGRYTGTWIGSMMSKLWIYDGELDPSGRVLSLFSEGPSMDGSGATAKYKDVIEMVSDDHRTLKGHIETADGGWECITTTHYHRVK